MADVRFITDNPFMKAWAEGDERSRREAETAQRGDLRRQQIEASREAVRTAQDTRTREAAADQALRDMAVTRANPLETVVARQRPDMSLTGMTGGLDSQDVPRVTEPVRTTAAPGLPNAAAVARAAQTPGTGKVLMEHVTGEHKRIADERKQTRDDSAKLIEAFGKDPEAAILMMEQQGIKLPDQFKNDRLRLAHLKGVAAALHQLSPDLQERLGPKLIGEALGVSVPQGRPKMAHYDPYRGVGFTKEGDVIAPPGLPERQTGARATAEPRPTMPKITKTEDGLMDMNTGAYASWIPATPEQPGKSRWFGPDEPGKPAQPGRWQWTSPDNRPLPGGPQDMYSGGRVVAGGGAMPASGAASVTPDVFTAAQAAVQAGLQSGASRQEIAQGLTAKGYSPELVAKLIGSSGPAVAPSAPTVLPGAAPRAAARNSGEMIGATEAARRAAAAVPRTYREVPEPPGVGSTPQEFNAWEAQYGEQYRVNQDLVERMRNESDAKKRADAAAGSLAGRLRARQQMGAN